MPKSALYCIAVAGVAGLVSASPLSEITSLSLDRREPAPVLFQLTLRHHYHLRSGSDVVRERAQAVAVNYAETDADWAPLWTVEHNSYLLHAEIDGVQSTLQASERLAGVGLAVPGYRLLLGPDRFEVGRQDSWRLGWAEPVQQVSLKLTRNEQNWRSGFRQQAGYAYAIARSGDYAFGFHYGDSHRWGVDLDGASWSFRVDRGRQSWPAMSDQWNGRSASLQQVELDRKTWSAQYRPVSGHWLETLGLAHRHWTLKAHGVVPFEESAGGVKANGALSAHDAWADLGWRAWHGRVLVRHAQPEASGAHYSIYFPGLGERWTETGIESAWLLGTRLEYDLAIQPRSRLVFWAQQWWPLMVERSDTTETSSDGGIHTATGEDKDAGGGFQLGLRWSLHP